MATLSASQLERALDKIFDFMEEKGIRLNDEKKAEFKKQIADDLHNELTFDDIKDVNVQKKLISCITALVMGKDKDFKEMMDTLKSDKKDSHDDKLDAKLTAQLMLLTMLTKILDPESKKNKTLTPNEFKKLIPTPKDKKQKENDETKQEKHDEVDQQLDATLRNLYGGDNPTINGEVNFPIVGPVVGNLFAFTNQTTPDPKGLSEMVESITYNKGKVDYMGLENIAMVNDMSDGIDVSAAVSPSMTPRAPGKA